MIRQHRLLRHAAVLLAALGAGCGGGSSAPEPEPATAQPAGVRATIVDAGGGPVANAPVTVDGVASGLRTDAGGNVMVELDPGRHELAITATDRIVGTVPLVVPDFGMSELGTLRVVQTPSGTALEPEVTLGSSNFDCGGYQQHNCTVVEWEYWNGGFGVAQSCDRALQCGSDLKFCVIGEGVCRNDTRWQDRAEQIRQGWAYGALAEQRKIARFEPLNWTAIISSHNAFNNAADGYVLKPNQISSMTDQLQMGARKLMLDVHTVCDVTCEVRLSHAEVKSVLGVEIHLGASAGDRHLGFGLMEIRQWLDRNPGEVVLLGMEEHLDDLESLFDYAWAFEHFLGPYLLRHSEKPAGRWPTLAEMRELDRRVIAFGSLDGLDYFFEGDFSSPYEVARPKFFDAAACALDNGKQRFELAYPGERFLRVEESRYIIDLPGWTPFDGYTSSGVIAEDCSSSAYPCAPVAAITACGNSELALDFVGDDAIDAMVPIGDRFTPMVWSWKQGERGWERDGLAALLQAADGRWMARDPRESHRYACGRLREGDPAQWADQGQLSDWKVTVASGPFDSAAFHCATEFGADHVFSVPVNAAQNRQVVDAMGGTDAVWIAYRDVRTAAGEVEWDRDVPCVEGAEPAPGTVWPPNHKMASVSLAVRHHCAVPPVCLITGVTSDDPTATPADWRITGALDLELRAERPGAARSGRRYAVELQCTIEPHDTAYRTGALVTVPHDQR